MTGGGMDKVHLGRTGLMVTPVCFGASGLGDMPDTYGYGVDAERAKATVRAIFDGPVNFLDTSRIYGMGRSEERIGAVIRERGGLPAGFVLSSKLDRDPETKVFDAARARRSLELSLRALGLERIGLLHLHDPEHSRSLAEATGRDGALGELFRIREEGLASAVGLAAGTVEMMMPLLRDWDFDALITHNRFTLVNRNAEEMLDFAKVQRHRGAQRGALCRRHPRQGVERLSSLRLSGGDARSCAGSDTPHRGDLRSSRRASRRRSAAVFHARPAGRLDDLRRKQARAGRRRRSIGRGFPFPRRCGRN